MHAFHAAAQRQTSSHGFPRDRARRPSTRVDRCPSACWFTAASMVLFVLMSAPLTAQRGGGGKGGGGNNEPTSIYRPVIFGYPDNIGGGSDLRYDDPDPEWMSLIHFDYSWFHPDQMQLDGGGRGLVRSVSLWGDLTHGGASTRYVLDVREAAGGSRALISTAETVGTPDNPTWYYDGAGNDDDGTDNVLLTDANYTLVRARWSGSNTRIAFEGTRKADNKSGIFVCDVVATGGVPTGIGPISLVAADGAVPSWGGDNHIAFLRHTGGDPNGFVVVVTSPSAPVEIPLGTVKRTAPTLSSTGQLVVYSKEVGGRWDLFVRDLLTAIETRITDSTRVPETQPAYPTWSPDDMHILFSVNDQCGGSCRSLAIIDTIGTAKRTTITKTFIVKDGQGRSSRNVILGAQASAIWRN